MSDRADRATETAVALAGGIAKLVTLGKAGDGDGAPAQPDLPDLTIPKGLETFLRSALTGSPYTVASETLTSREGGLRREVMTIGGPVRLILAHIPPEVVTSPAGAGPAIGRLEYLLPPGSRTLLFSTGIDELPPSVAGILEQWGRGGLDARFKSWIAVSALPGRDDPQAAAAELLELPVPGGAPGESPGSERGPETVEVFVAHDEADAKEKYLQEMVEWLRGGLRRFGFEFARSDQVPTGEDRDRWIQETLEGANLLLAVVTQNLLNSTLNDRIAEVARRRRGGPWLYPVLLGPCDWQSYDWIKQVAAQPKDGTIGENYSSRYKRQALFNRILNEIRDRRAELARGAPAAASNPEGVG